MFEFVREKVGKWLLNFLHMGPKWVSAPIGTKTIRVYYDFRGYKS